MKCRHCDIEIVLTNGVWWQAHTTNSLCRYSVSGRHEPAEPTTARCKHEKDITQLGPSCKQCESEVNAGIVEGLNAMEKQPYTPYVTELVEDHGPRIDTVPFPPAPKDERAASVQQEPLSASTNLQGRLIGNLLTRWELMTNDFKSVVDEQERNFYEAMHDLVKSVDNGEFWPAPRTQGSEIQFIGDVRRKYFMPYDCSWNGFIREVTAELEHSGEVYEDAVIAKINQKGAALLSALEWDKAFAAQPQPAPLLCPNCGRDLNKPPFFTAPEAQPNNKEEPK